MNIAIIGCGVIGFATGQGFAKFGHEVGFVDRNPKSLVKAKFGKFAVYQNFKELKGYPDVIFVCVPEDVLEECLDGLVKDIRTSCDLVIRSSCFPGTTARLQKQYHKSFIRFVHNPEFLRERNALEDFLLSQWVILGTTPDMVGELNVNVLYEKMQKRVIYTDSTTSEAVKLAINTYLATNISFWSQWKSLCDKVGINSHEVARIAMNDQRVSPYGAVNHGDRPFGGFCLPKDLTAVLSWCEQNGITMPILKAVGGFNLSIGGKERDEHKVRGE